MSEFNCSPLCALPKAHIAFAESSTQVSCLNQPPRLWLAYQLQATGKVTTTISMGGPKDVDLAVKAAHEAYEQRWGLKVPGSERGRLLMKLASLVEDNLEELAAIEALDNGAFPISFGTCFAESHLIILSGKTFSWAKTVDVPASVQCLRYYGGWADKNHGKVIEVDESKLAYTRHEPIGVVGQIIPWNFPLMMMAWKLGPALATGNTIVLKPSEFTPLAALRMVSLIEAAGFPPGVVNIVNGYGATAGNAISSHPNIEKVAFTGSTLVGRKIMEVAAQTNLKKVTLELGGKSPNIIFDDADVEQAVDWAAHGVLYVPATCLDISHALISTPPVGITAKPAARELESSCTRRSMTSSSQNSPPRRSRSKSATPLVETPTRVLRSRNCSST